MPEAVVIEIDQARRAGYRVPTFEAHPWIQVRKVTVPSYIEMVVDLGRGEAEALALASELDDPLVIIDDRLARQLAQLQRFRITGTAGVLLRAKQKGLIPAVAPYLENLKEAGFFIGADVEQRILTLAEERA